MKERKEGRRGLEPGVGQRLIGAGRRVWQSDSRCNLLGDSRCG